MRNCLQVTHEHKSFSSILPHVSWSADGVGQMVTTRWSFGKLTGCTPALISRSLMFIWPVQLSSRCWKWTCSPVNQRDELIQWYCWQSWIDHVLDHVASQKQTLKNTVSSLPPCRPDVIILDSVCCCTFFLPQFVQPIKRIWFHNYLPHLPPIVYNSPPTHPSPLWLLKFLTWFMGLQSVFPKDLLLFPFHPPTLDL